MRPLRLTLQAMGPFAGCEVIDFRPALDARLFGIYGPTGAGKTSIFDGICYALFGELSAEMGLTDLKLRPIRSTFSAPDVETAVSLVFEVGEKAYHIQRWPRQEIAKKRGGGTKQKAPNAALFDVTGIPLEDITQSQPGDVLAERKVTVVNQAIIDILGYDAKQFRQIVLLPQGEFRKLLTASSDDRSKILQGLFDVSLYDKYTDKLRSERKTLETELKTAIIQKKSILENHGVESEEDLAAAVDSLNQDIAQCTTQSAQIDQKLAAAQTALGRDKQTEALFVEVEQAEAEQQALLQNQSEMEQVRHHLKQAQKAVALLPYETQKKATRDEYKNISDQYTEQKNVLEKATKAHNLAEQQKKKIDSRAELRLDLSQEIVRLEGLTEKLRQATPKIAAHSTAQQEVDVLQVSLEKGHALLKEATEAAQGFQAAEKKLAKQEKHHLTLKNEILALRQAFQETNTYEKTLQKVDAAALALQMATQHHEKAVSAEETASRTFEEAEASLAATQAFILAQKLQKGDPCPVCGSKEHPQLAHEGSAGEGLDKAFRVAKDALDQARQRGRETADILAASQGKYDTLKESLTALKVPTVPATELAEQGANKAVDVEAVEAVIDEIRVQLEKHDAAEVEKQTTALEEIKAKYDSAVLRVTELGARVEALLMGIPEAQRSLSEVQSVLGQKQQKLAEEEQALQQAEIALKEATEDHVVATAAVTASREAVEQAAERRDAGSRAFVLQLEKAGVTEADFVAAQADIEKIEALEKKYTDYTQKTGIASDRLKRAKAMLEGKVRPDIAEAEAMITLLQEKKTTLSEHQGALDIQRQNYHKSQVRLTELKYQFKQQEDQLALIGTLADLAEGKNDEKLRLVDYVIATTFEDVLQAATLRFSKMTQQRYALVRKSQADSGVRKTTLDIMIYDSYTDDLRPASSLSGGEGFLASLSLALGLSDVVQAEAGGIRLDAIFIDEGFGTLSEDVLDSALSTLRDMVGADRAVGVISHLDQVKREIPLGFTIDKTASGSFVRPRGE